VAKKSKNKLVQLAYTAMGFLLKLILIGAQWMLVLLILYRVVPVPITPLHLKRVVEQLADGKEVRLKKSWKSMEYLGEQMPRAILAAEDIRFPDHWGFDLEQMQKAIEASIQKGKKLRGASTITQQTAKNLFFTPERSWLRKGPELIITLSLELLWTKKRILEVYMNIIETGDGIYGMQAAAQYYFNKDCRKLTKRQAALLASCLPNPRRWRPDKPTRYIEKKATKVQRWMKDVDVNEW
jgi:monofunctional biosynthetic peptidoglycan transglycosylase